MGWGRAVVIEIGHTIFPGDFGFGFHGNGYGRPQAGTRPYPALWAIAFGDAISALHAPSTTGYTLSSLRLEIGMLLSLFHSQPVDNVHRFDSVLAVIKSVRG